MGTQPAGREEQPWDFELLQRQLEPVRPMEQRILLLDDLAVVGRERDDAFVEEAVVANRRNELPDVSVELVDARLVVELDHATQLACLGSAQAERRDRAPGVPLEAEHVQLVDRYEAVDVGRRDAQRRGGMLLHEAGDVGPRHVVVVRGVRERQRHLHEGAIARVRAQMV